MGVKSILAYTNPFLYIVGFPVFVGISLASLTYNWVSNTEKVCKSLIEDLDE